MHRRSRPSKKEHLLPFGQRSTKGTTLRLSSSMPLNRRATYCEVIQRLASQTYNSASKTREHSATTATSTRERQTFIIIMITRRLLQTSLHRRKMARTSQRFGEASTQHGRPRRQRRDSFAAVASMERSPSTFSSHDIQHLMINIGADRRCCSLNKIETAKEGCDENVSILDLIAQIRSM
ncbi:hypothetical protein THAOC_04623 [Thalassiosira oceanica]|uniref:Uncharacterized protein n=1 Tax=Thalassiosira oceanica TaxID=159749 RepID=K0TIW1_THAOC|nr:hypothetical protein THAOC_04623 [Thalassiosira oceanica]|eukprot:EJK73736.1 hypothetical protein THAOC_04623 [Thalassiosira oceanica]